MNIYEKAVAGATDLGVWINVWNHDLQDAHSFRIHDEEITWWAEYYDEQQNEKQ
jgi:hypothetical protein